MSSISEAEKQQRRLAVESTIGTHAMEGIRLESKVLSIMNAFAEGALTLDEFSAAMDAHAFASLEGNRVLKGAA